MQTIRDKMYQSRYLFSILILLGLAIVASMLSSSFMKPDNLLTIVRQASLLLLLSTGLTAVVLSGGIDLSIGNTAGLAGCICAQLLVNGVPIWAAILISALVGLVVGLFNGFLVGILKLAPFVATYGTNWVVGGLATIVMGGAVIYDLPSGFNKIGVGFAGPVPIPIIISAVVVAIFYVLLQKTTFGRNLYIFGCNNEAARYSAMNTRRMLFMTYMLSGLTAGLGGIVISARLNAAEAMMGDIYGLQIVAAVVMGGTSLLGGEGGIIGTIIGALVLTIITNLMNLMNITSFFQSFAVGVVILAMVSFDIFIRERRDRVMAAA